MRGCSVLINFTLATFRVVKVGEELSGSHRQYKKDDDDNDDDDDDDGANDIYATPLAQ